MHAAVGCALHQIVRQRATVLGPTAALRESRFFANSLRAHSLYKTITQGTGDGQHTQKTHWDTMACRFHMIRCELASGCFLTSASAIVHSCPVHSPLIVTAG
jgi:hypothetical protein